MQSAAALVALAQEFEARRARCKIAGLVVGRRRRSARCGKLAPCPSFGRKRRRARFGGPEVGILHWREQRRHRVPLV